MCCEAPHWALHEWLVSFLATGRGMAGLYHYWSLVFPTGRWCIHLRRLPMLHYIFYLLLRWGSIWTQLLQWQEKKKLNFYTIATSSQYTALYACSFSQKFASHFLTNTITFPSPIVWATSRMLLLHFLSAISNEASRSWMNEKHGLPYYS